MPDVYRILKSSLDKIADAIRAKTGNTGDLTPAQMVEEIESIETGGGNIVETSGSFTPASDTTDYEVSHGLGKIPFMIMVWPARNENISGKHVVGGYTAYMSDSSIDSQIILGNRDALIKLGFFLENGGYTQEPNIEMTVTGNYVKNLSATSFHLTSSGAYPIPAGIEFNWRAFAMND